MGHNRVSNAEYSHGFYVLSVEISLYLFTFLPFYLFYFFTFLPFYPFTFLPFYLFTLKLFRVRQHFSLKIRNKVVNKKYCLPPLNAIIQRCAKHRRFSPSSLKTYGNMCKVKHSVGKANRVLHQFESFFAIKRKKMMKTGTSFDKYSYLCFVLSLLR